MTKTQKRPTRTGKGKKSERQKLLGAVLASFSGGAAVCTALLAAFSLVLTNTPIPLTMVRPLSCLAAAAGVAVSGLVLAKMIGRQRLLCGLGCGLFYSVCQMTAVFAINGSFPKQSADFMMPVALLLSGMLGGALAALRPEH